MKNLLALIVTIFLCPAVMGQNETPAKFEPTNRGFNYVRRTAEIRGVRSTS